MKNFLSKLKENAKAVKASVLAGLATVLTFGAAFAAEGDNVAPTAAELKTNIIDPLTTGFSTTYILGIIAAVIAAGVVYLVLWWAVRYVWRRMRSFVKGGRGRI